MNMNAFCGFYSKVGDIIYFIIVLGCVCVCVMYYSKYYSVSHILCDIKIWTKRKLEVIPLLFKWSEITPLSLLVFFNFHTLFQQINCFYALWYIV